jgi:hypothetical protein
MTEEKHRLKQETTENDSLELLLEEQARNQVRSDYRRSLGSEAKRRYME